MQACVEGAISGCSKQHSRVAPVCANMPTRLWQDANVDFTCKKNILWAKRDAHGEFSTLNDRMQPTFASSYRTVLIPFDSRMTGPWYLPREHPLIKHRSFGDRFVEGTYLHADHDTPCIHMHCITLGLGLASELLVQDFKAYTDESAFRDSSSLLQCTPAILKNSAQLHFDDAHDDSDKLVAEETALHVHAHAQTEAADVAKVLRRLHLSDSPFKMSQTEKSI